MKTKKEKDPDKRELVKSLWRKRKNKDKRVTDNNFQYQAKK